MSLLELGTRRGNETDGDMGRATTIEHAATLVEAALKYLTDVAPEDPKPSPAARPIDEPAAVGHVAAHETTILDDDSSSPRSYVEAITASDASETHAVTNDLDSRSTDVGLHAGSTLTEIADATKADKIAMLARLRAQVSGAFDAADVLTRDK